MPAAVPATLAGIELFPSETKIPSPLGSNMSLATWMSQSAVLADFHRWGSQPAIRFRLPVVPGGAEIGVLCCAGLVLEDWIAD